MNPDPDQSRKTSQDSTDTAGAQSLWLRPGAVPDPKDIPRLFRQHRSLARTLKAFLQPWYRSIPAFAQGPTADDDRARFERVFRPWPKWVLRLSAELWHVDYPTVPKDVIFQSLRALHIAAFCRLFSSTEPLISGKASVMSRIDLSVLPIVWGAFVGHSVEHHCAIRASLDVAREAGQISAEEHAAQIRLHSPELIEQQFRRMLELWAGHEDFKPFKLTEAVQNARSKTFDRHGQRKETELTPIYRVMFANWITVENMTGPKELASFLSPHLHGTSKSPMGEIGRIATMCSRLGVKFRGRVKQF